MSKLKKAVAILSSEGIGGLKKKTEQFINRKKQQREFYEKAKSFHLISEEERSGQRAYSFREPKTFSIVTPLYNTPKTFLVELIESLEKQTYSNWEFCLADGSDEEHSYVGEYCLEKMKHDTRIKYHKLSDNKGISDNTNACLKLATGDYIGLLDHDDILHESALFEMMKVIESTGADFLYSDEVKFNGDIQSAVDFNFKPAFGKDELRSHNFICHFTVFAKTLLDGEDRFYRSEYDGSQDYDMVLRLTEKAKRIEHVSKVLYYWRVHEGSVSMNLDSKSYAVDSAIRAISEQLKRSGENGEVVCNLPYRTIYRIHYQIPQDAKVTVLIHGSESEEEYSAYAQDLKQRTTYPIYEMMQVETAASQTFGQQVNACVKRTTSDYIVLIEDGCIPKTEDWIEQLLMYAQRTDVCCVTPKILADDATIAYTGLAIDNQMPSRIKYLGAGYPDAEQGYEAIFRYARNVTAVWKGCCMFARETYDLLDGFEEDMQGYEEIDFSMKGIQRGLWNVSTCFAQMQLEDYKKNTLTEDTEGNEAQDTDKFVKKWEQELQKGDPFYHFRLKELDLL